MAPAVTPLKPPRHFNFIRNAAAADFLYLAPYPHACANDRSGDTCVKAQRWLLGLRSESDPPPMGATLQPHACTHVDVALSRSTDCSAHCDTVKRVSRGASGGREEKKVEVAEDSVRVLQPRTFRGAPVATHSCINDATKPWVGVGGNNVTGGRALVTTL